MRLYFLSGAVALVLLSRARFPFAELDVQVHLFLHAVAVLDFVVVGCGVRCCRRCCLLLFVAAFVVVAAVFVFVVVVIVVVVVVVTSLLRYLRGEECFAPHLAFSIRKQVPQFWKFWMILEQQKDF